MVLNRDKPSVGRIEPSRKNGGDVKGNGWIASKNRRRVGDIELSFLQSDHFCRMGLAQEDRQFAKHGTGCIHAGDLHSILDHLYSATPEEGARPSLNWRLVQLPGLDVSPRANRQGSSRRSRNRESVKAWAVSFCGFQPAILWTSLCSSCVC